MATKDGNGNIITDTYLPLSGGTLTGNLITDGGNIYAEGGIISVSGEESGYYFGSYGGAITMESSSEIDINKPIFVNGWIKNPNYAIATAAIEFSGDNNIKHGGVIDFHFARSTADYTSRIIETGSGQLSINRFRVRMSDGRGFVGDDLNNPVLYSRIGYSYYLDYFWVANDLSYLGCKMVNANDYGITWWVSDKRLKTNIEDTTINALDLINKIECKSFDWKDGMKSSVRCGLISQQLEDIGLDDCIIKVKQSEDSDSYKEGIHELYQIDDGRIIPYLIKSIQELSQQNKELLDRISILENKLNDA